MRNFLQLLQVPSFAPYKWFYPDRYPPYQPVFVVLTWLKRFDTYIMAPLAEMSLYLADELLDTYAYDHDGMAVDGEPSLSSGTRLAQEWQMLKALRGTIQGGTSGFQPSETPQATQRTEQSGSQANLSELDAWSTSFAKSLD